MAAFLICDVSTAQQVEEIDSKIALNLKEHEMIYKHFHQYPELSFKEFKTSENCLTSWERLVLK